MWQDAIALVIVAATAGLLALRTVRRVRSGKVGDCSSCPAAQPPRSRPVASPLIPPSSLLGGAKDRKSGS
jgi:hypothetical protein